MTTVKSQPTFSLGKLYVTRRVTECLPVREVIHALYRHSVGDWGHVNEQDWKSNDQAVTGGSRLVSSYSTVAGAKFWIITEGDRSATSVLFPEEY